MDGWESPPVIRKGGTVSGNDVNAIEILLVEDNPGDVRLVQEAVKEFKVSNKLHVVGDGVAAMEYVRGEGQYQERDLPDLILLDLNLPRMSGHEILAELKGDPDLRRIPVVVLSTSAEYRDLQQSYDLHANCYVTKPVDFDRFIEVVQAIEGFWMSIVRLPEA